MSFVLLFAMHSGIRAQDHVSFDSLGIEQGLSQSYVYAIHQDRTGFLWFGTENGLNRYDGYRFRIFSYDPADANGISESNIWTIFEDREGILWVGTINGGLNRHDPKKSGFTAYRHDPADPKSLSNDIVLAICEDRHGNLWVGTNGGLNRMDRRSGAFTRFMRDENDEFSLSDNLVYAILEDRKGRLWIGTQNGGLNLFDSGKERFISFDKEMREPHRIPDNFVRDIVEDRDGSLWLATIGGGLVHFDPDTMKVIGGFRFDANDPSTLPNDEVTAVFIDRNGTLWCGTRAGLAAFERQSGTFTRFVHSDSDPQSICSNSIYSIGQDDSGILWFGTFAGISKLDPRTNRFHHIMANDQTGGLKGNNVFAIFEDGSDLLWVGTDRGGLNRFDRATGAWTQYRNDVHDPRSISSDFVRSVYEDSFGVFWVGTGGSGLNRRLPDGGFKHYTFGARNPTQLVDNYVRVLFEDSRRQLWLGTNGGLQRYLRETDSFVSYRNDSAKSDSISQNFIYSINEDPQGNLWVGTRYGLNRMDRRNGGFTRYNHDPADENSLSEDEVFSLEFSANGTLWVGTSNGLNRYDATSDRFQRYLDLFDHEATTVYSIREDAAGQLWMGTNRGLVRFDPASNEVRIFYQGDGIQSNEFNLGASMVSRNGELYFGGVKGFNHFLPAEITEISDDSPFLLTGVSVFGRPFIPDQECFSLSRIELDYRDTYVSFEFAVLDYRAPAKNLYSWRLEGLDREWVRGTQRVANYANLSPGTYTLRVRGANSSGVWSKNALALLIVVNPPFWDTWWFRGLAVLLILAVGGGMIMKRSHFHKLQRARLQREVESRTRELKSALEELDSFAYTVSHDLRAPLRLAAQYTSLLKENLADRLGDEERLFMRKINGSLRHMDSLINDILWFSRASRVELIRTPIDLSFLGREVILGKSQANPDRHVEVVIQPEIMVEGDESLLRVMMENLLDNAWKYTSFTENARIEFGATVNDGNQVLFVRDNGAGFEPDKAGSLFVPFMRLHTDREFEGTGVGLATVKRIVERHGGTIWAEGAPGEGATFYFTLN